MSPQRESVRIWRAAFLSTLSKTANVRASCEVAGVTRKTAYLARSQSVEFRAQWDEAIDDAVDSLEAIAHERAKGTSDTLMIFLLKAHRPDRYRENVRHEHTGEGGGPMTFHIVYDEPEDKPSGDSDSKPE